MRRVHRLGGVAAAVEAFVVEALRRLLGRAPVARRDVGAAVAHLLLVAARHELQLDARRGQADVGRLDLVRVGADRERRGLGHAEAGEHPDALAALLLGDAVELVPDRLRQAGAGEEEHLDAAEERLAQDRIDLERVGDLLEALGHVEVDRRRDLAQVAQRLADQRRRRLAFVDVERAAVVEDEADVVVAAEGVVPGQPVDQHRRLLGQLRKALADHLLVRAQHALRVDHALRQLGRSGREQELGDRVGADARMRCVDGGGRLGSDQLGERRDGATVEPAFAQDDRRLGGNDRGDRLAVCGPLANTSPGVSMPRMWRSLP
jgi:hypothetical protein